MNISPQLRLSLGLVALLTSIAFIGDFLGLMPRAETQTRELRKLMGETLAVQLSTAAARGDSQMLQTTLEELVLRNDSVLYSALVRDDGRRVASFGDTQYDSDVTFDHSSFDNLVVPIYEGNTRWGEARLRFMPTADWGLRFLGVPRDALFFFSFLAVASLLTFYLFMRKALAELNPSRAVPERVSAAFDVLAEGVLILDEKERIVLANRAVADKLGEEPENMIGSSPSSYEWDLRGDDVEELPWQHVLKHGEPVMSMPLRLQVDEAQITFTVNAAPITGGHGEPKGVLITFDDVTPLEAKNAELAKTLAELSVTQKVIEDKNRQLEVLATRDSLTGCLNRRSFIGTYRNQHAMAQKGSALSVLMVDIDHFKRVNDTHGHMVGDQVIKLVASILRDAFTKPVAVGRYGGEEFIVSLPGRDLNAALQCAEQVRTRIAALAEHDGCPVDRVTVSIGAASTAPELQDPMEVIERADRALYQAKETGRDRVCRFDPSYQASSSRKKRAPQPESESSGKTTMMLNLRSKLHSMERVVRRQAEEITHKAMHDELTGLPNRFLLQDRLTQAMKLSDRNSNITAVVSLSMSAYRRVHELMGHDAADGVIREAVGRIQEVVRSVDTIGVTFNEQALTFSRIGDNELAMLIVDLENVESVAKVVARTTSALERPFSVDGDEIVNEVHCGVALYPNDGTEPELLIRNASLARSHAERRSPRSDTAYFSREIDSLAAKNAGIAAELRRAIRQNGLQVAYQPKVDSVTKRVTGVEALARWAHPELGQVGPTEFITIAENIGVIDQLTDWMFRRVCEDISSGNLDGLRCSVNVSALELYDPRTAERILDILREKNVSPHQLEVEITESSILNNFELARTILTRLQNAGLLVVLDDFGTAYSSLNLLLEIPVDVIKVDRCFVSDLQHATNNRAVVRAIIQMAQAMDKRVVAEGVESTEERDCLIRLGCREMQGYLYSKPMAFADLQAYIREHGVHDFSNLAALAMLERSA